MAPNREITMHSNQVDPSKIMQIGSGFFATKTLLSAVELGLFTTLARHARRPDQRGGRLQVVEPDVRGRGEPCS